MSIVSCLFLCLNNGTLNKKKKGKKKKKKEEEIFSGNLIIRSLEERQFKKRENAAEGTKII